jgi:hypothetical protein
MSDATSSDSTKFDFANAMRTVEQIQDEMKDIVVMPGRTRGELKDAFDLVKPKDNWKMPIEARLPVDTDADKLALIEDAVIFFTGGCIQIERDAKGITVYSEGYYHHIGA